MCGILGRISWGEKNSRDSRFGIALRSLSHRGPDFSSVLVPDEFAELGHCRLSIIDLSSRANQPMSFDGLFMSFNGEIYNFRELRSELMNLGLSFDSDSDSELLLRAFDYWGDAIFAKLQGMFAVAFWDSKEKTLTLARDRFGEKPLFFFRSEKDEQIVFGSEMRSLLMLSSDSFSISQEFFDSYLCNQYADEPLTLFREVNRVKPGEIVRMTQNGEEHNFFWKHFHDGIHTNNGNRARTKSIEFVKNEIKELLVEAVRKTLVSDVPVGLSLSGGLDSSLIAAVTSKLLGKELLGFTFQPEGHTSIDESSIAQTLAQQLDIRLEIVRVQTNDFVDSFDELVSALDEPIADPASYAIYRISRAAHEAGFKVLLSGLGGDEFHWGYGWTLENVDSVIEVSKNRLQASALTEDRLRLNRQLIPDVLVQGDIFESVFQRQRFRNLLPNTIGNLDAIEDSRHLLSPYDLPRRIMSELNQTWLVSNCLNLTDRLSMANSVETRLPFLDAELTEYMLNIQSELVFTLGSKFFLRAIAKDLLPESIVNKPKTGFQVPGRLFMKKTVERYQERLAFNQLNRVGLLGTEMIKQVNSLDKANGHNIAFIYKLLILETWLDQNIDRVSFRQLDVDSEVNNGNH